MAQRWNQTAAMANLENVFKKAFYMGVGIANYAVEKANRGVQEVLQEFGERAQKLADEMVARGEMTTEEARKYVEELMQQAQNPQVKAKEEKEPTAGPRRIEILVEDEPENNTRENSKESERVESLRQQMQSLQEELRRLQQNK